MVIFFFMETPPAGIYTLSLHDALPIFRRLMHPRRAPRRDPTTCSRIRRPGRWPAARREIGRHTSELQSRQYLVCRLLLEKKKPQPRPSDSIPAKPTPPPCLTAPPSTAT